jgi:hypothetical protein
MRIEDWRADNVGGHARPATVLLKVQHPWIPQVDSHCFCKAQKQAPVNLIEQRHGAILIAVLLHCDKQTLFASRELLHHPQRPLVEKPFKQAQC